MYLTILLLSNYCCYSPLEWRPRPQATINPDQISPIPEGVGAICPRCRPRQNGMERQRQPFCHFPEPTGISTVVCARLLVTPPPLSCPLSAPVQFGVFDLFCISFPIPRRGTLRAFLAASEHASALDRRNAACRAHDLLGQSLAPQLPTNLPNPESLLPVLFSTSVGWLGYQSAVPVRRRDRIELTADCSPHGEHQQRSDVTRLLVSMNTCNSSNDHA